MCWGLFCALWMMRRSSRGSLLITLCAKRTFCFRGLRPAQRKARKKKHCANQRSDWRAFVSTVLQVATQGEVQAPFPSVFKEGWLRLNKRSRSTAAQTGWLLKGRVASLYARVALHIFV